VRNLSDGRVEAVIEGDETGVRELVEWCEGGPPHATVEHVEVRWETPTGELSGFSAI
jgi:acylphosphatase